MSDDIEAEFVPEEEAEQGSATLKKLRERLAKAVQEKQEFLEGWQRARADFVNYKKEEAGMQQEREARAVADLVGALLPALDSFELALRHAQTKEMNLVHKQLLDGLRKLQVECFGKAGDKFDPYKYEALREVSAETPEEDHKVVSVERSGYSIGDKIIRPAQVAVGVYNK